MIDSTRLVSISESMKSLTPLNVLHRVRGQSRFMWANERDGFALVGFGTAAELVAWSGSRFMSIQRQAQTLFKDAVILNADQPHVGPRLFGGFAFQDDFVPDNTWTIYAPAWFILPHYQFTQVGESAWLTINVRLPVDEDYEAIIPELRQALQDRIALLIESEDVQVEKAGEPASLDYPMPYNTWRDNILEATHLMNETALKKVVLSRVAEIGFDGRVNIDAALAYLNQQYADSYRFLFEPRPAHAFFGATPELLAQVQGDQLRTMGLAGSIRRGSTGEEDDAYASTLLNDPKERHEHALVVAGLRERLEPVTSALHIPETPGILKLNNIQHLHTPVTGILREANGVLPLVESLHPTPALGGEPRDVALKFIKDAEPVPRGWYAAPVGWLDPNLDGAFGVAIRSAVSQERRVWLYAGAGIVADSQPQKEWDETALKFRPMLEALGIKEKMHV